MSIRLRLIGAFIIALLISVLLFAQLVQYQWTRAIGNIEQRTLKRLENHVDDVLEQRYSQASVGLAIIAENPVVQEAFAARDRDTLVCVRLWND